MRARSLARWLVFVGCLLAGSLVLAQTRGASITPAASASFNALSRYLLGGVLVNSSTAPTIASGGCTSPAVTHANGNATFLLTLGSSCSGVKTITLTFPAAAHFWSCQPTNNTSSAQQDANVPEARATSTTAVVITNYGRTTGLQTDFTAADTVLLSCTAE